MYWYLILHLILKLLGRKALLEFKRVRPYSHMHLTLGDDTAEYKWQGWKDSFILFSLPLAHLPTGLLIVYLPKVLLGRTFTSRKEMSPSHLFHRLFLRVCTIETFLRNNGLFR